MNFKTTYILFGILIVLIGVVALALWYDPNARNDKNKYVLPALQEKDSIKPTDIDRVEIERRDKDKIVLVREPSGERWSMTEPKTLRADSVAVNHLITQLFAATREEKVAVPPNLATWGLTPPEQTITIKKGNERAYTLQVGNQSPGGGDAVIYVLDPGRPKEPMAVRLASLDAVLTPFDDFRDTELLGSAVGDVEAVRLSEGNDTVAWKKTDKHWFYEEPKYGEADNGPDDPPVAGVVQTPKSINTILTDITNIKVERTDKKPDFVSDDVADFAKYLEPFKAKILTIGITRMEDAGKDENGKRKTKAVAMTLLVGIPAAKDDKYFAQIKGDKTVVKVAAKNVDPLLKVLSDKGALRDRYLVHLDNPPSAVDVKNAYGTIQLRRTHAPKLTPEMEQMMKGQQFQMPDSWTLWRGPETSSSVNTEFLEGPGALVSVLRQKDLIVEFIDRKATPEERAQQEKQLGIDKPSAELLLWDDEDGIVKEDANEPLKPDAKRKPPRLKSEKEPTYKLYFGDVSIAHDREVVAVKREAKTKDGYEVTLVKIPKLALDDAKKNPLAYMDKKLERFTEAGLSPWKGVTKVVIQRESQTIEVTREKDDAPWKIVKPANLAGRNADKAAIENVLSLLNNHLVAQRLVTEKAKDDELETTFGLKKPQTKVEITLTKDGKPETYTYDFGKDAEGGGVYAKQSQRPLIFTVDKPVLAQLPTDVLDPVVFTLNPDKVKKVTLTGWQDLLGEPRTLEFEKKDNKWEVTKGLPKDKFSAGKLAMLLDGLREVRAVRFAEFNTGAKPEYKLEVPKGALAMEITLEGEEKPITLSVGAADGDKGFFATSNRSNNGDVFVLPKVFFEDLKKGPAYFAVQ